MSVTVEKALLWLFVINLGIAFGAALYEHRIVLSRWISTSTDSRWHWNPDAARQDDTGRRFWAFVTTVPLTLLTLASLFAAWRAPDAAGMVAGRSGGRTCRQDHYVFLLHTDDGQTDAHRRHTRIGGDGEAVGERELRAPCATSDRVVGCAEGVLGTIPAPGVAVHHRSEAPDRNSLREPNDRADSA